MCCIVGNIGTRFLRERRLCGIKYDLFGPAALSSVMFNKLSIVNRVAKGRKISGKIPVNFRTLSMGS